MEKKRCKITNWKLKKCLSGSQYVKNSNLHHWIYNMFFHLTDNGYIEGKELDEFFRHMMQTLGPQVSRLQLDEWQHFDKMHIKPADQAQSRHTNYKTNDVNCGLLASCIDTLQLIIVFLMVSIFSTWYTFYIYRHLFILKCATKFNNNIMKIHFLTFMFRISCNTVHLDISALWCAGSWAFTHPSGWVGWL